MDRNVGEDAVWEAEIGWLRDQRERTREANCLDGQSYFTLNALTTMLLGRLPAGSIVKSDPMRTAPLDV